MSADGGRRRREERGLASSLAVVLAGVLVAVSVAAVAGVRLLVVQRQAAAAADLSALAGAVALQHGHDGCDAVRRLAHHHRARVEHCAVTGEQVRVTVAVAAGALLGRGLTVQARAHAGPRRGP